MDYQVKTKEYWENRDIIGYLNEVNHPHRKLILDILKKEFKGFNNLLEIGCGPGANLVNIKKEFPKANLTGMDVNKLAIFKAREILPNDNFIIGDISTSLPFANKSFDVVLSDAILLYIDFFRIKPLLEQMLSISRKGLILVELGGEMKLGELKGNYWYRNYKKLLKRKGLKIIKYKIEKDIWSAPPWTESGYIYTVVHL